MQTRLDPSPIPSASRSRLRLRTPRPFAIALLVLLLGLVSACGGSASGNPSSTATASETAPDATTAGTEVSAGPISAKDYDPSLFDDTSHIVDNEWFPLVPGTHYVWEGRAFDDEGQRIDRRVEFIVTDLTKVIDGVRAVVGWDRDFNDGKMGESELIFYAQDAAGNVWHLGELVEHWDSRELDGARAWFVDSPEGARAGVQMLADPMVGDRYSQGFSPPPWFWDDRARVSNVGARTCVPVDCFDDAIITEEFEPRFPGAFQLKYFASGVGGIRVGWRGDDEEQEVMALTKFHQLGPEALAKVRARVLEQEARAYAYAQTEAATQRTDLP
jgi:hypothetical protein